MVVFFLLFCERILFGFLFRGRRIPVQFLYPLITGVSFEVCFFSQCDLGFFKELKIMLFTVTEIGFKYSSPSFYHNLRFQRVLLFLSGIVPSLLFWGLSIADSLASTMTTSISGLS